MASEFEDMLNEYAATVIERAQSNLRIKRRVRGKVVNRVASGNLLNSLIYKIRIRYGKPTIDFTVKGSAGQYADVIEFGRRPGAKMPPVAAIEKWIRMRFWYSRPDNFLMLSLEAKPCGAVGSGLTSVAVSGASP